MSYTPTEWKTGDVITSSGLNKMEEGIAAASSGGGGAFVVGYNTTETAMVLDKTAQEISDAFHNSFVMFAGAFGADTYQSQYMCWKIEEDESGYLFSFMNMDGNSFSFSAQTLNDYPSMTFN